MVRFIGKILVTAVAVIIAVAILPGVNLDNNASRWAPILFALVLALLNSFIKPILVVLTLPVTVFTLGLFLLVINIVIIEWAAAIVPGFHVTNHMSALWFSLLVSLIVYIIEKLISRSVAGEDEEGFED
jgi:putative membrane protein